MFYVIDLVKKNVEKYHSSLITSPREENESSRDHQSIKRNIFNVFVIILMFVKILSDLLLN